MAILTGNVKSSRVVTGEYKTGKRQGEDWEFLALEVIDAVTKGDLVGHKVRCKVASQSAGSRVLPDGREVMQIRSQVRKLEDLGEVSATE